MLMNGPPIKRIAIVGGGTAGWMAASMLARALPATGCVICVIESADIGTVGVGEATIPPIIDLLRFLNINEEDFVKHTQSTYKLGIKFTDWSQPGRSYWHPFGTFGAMLNLRPFQHAWHRARASGAAPRFNDFSLCAALGEAGKFRFADKSAQGSVAGLRYALHFDATLVAKYLRNYAEHLGVARLDRTVVSASQRADGFLDEIIFSDGSRLQADLFLDCSGFRGVLTEQVLRTGYVDWQQYLPCDRAVAVPTACQGPRPPFTEATALSAGWRWRIPLQHRIGNGYVYASAFLRDEDAVDDLLAAVGGNTLGEPRFLRFAAGHRKRLWNKNCVALGLASGFLEPLESTSIHLVMSGVYKLLEHFPDKDFAQPNIDSYNDELLRELERIRDFLVLHYCLTSRGDAPLWSHARAMTLPSSLQSIVALYKETGRVRPRGGDLFTDLSWFYIFEGMGIIPKHYDPLIDVVDLHAFRDILGSLALDTARAASSAPSHDSYFVKSAAAP